MLLLQHRWTPLRCADLLHVSRVTANQSVTWRNMVFQPQILLKQRLLAEIKNGLLFSHKTVSEIAYDFHFSEPSHLMRFFKKAYQARRVHNSSKTTRMERLNNSFR